MKSSFLKSKPIKQKGRRNPAFLHLEYRKIWRDEILKINIIIEGMRSELVS